MGMTPCRTTALVAEILHPLYSLSKVQLVSAEAVYQPVADDFGGEVDAWLLAAPVNDRHLNAVKTTLVGKSVWEGYSFVHTVSNMRLLAEHLGIVLHTAPSFYCVRDPFIPCFDGKVYLPRYTEQMRRVVECIHAANLYLDNTAATRTKNQLFNRWSGYTAEYTLQAEHESERIFGQPLPTFAHTYVEGGNIWQMTNRYGERQVCIGADHLLHTLHLLDHGRESWQQLAALLSERPSFAARCASFVASLEDREVVLVAEEMYAQGLLLQKGASGQIPRQLLLDMMVAKFKTGNSVIAPAEKGWLRQLAIALEAISALEWSEEIMAIRRPLVATYLAKRAVTHELIARDFGVEPAAVHFITQANCHLDLFMRPGPQHSVFIVDYALAAAICHKLLRAADRLCLSVEDRSHLERYAYTADKLNKELGPLLHEVHEQMAQVGFTVVPMPGSFVYEAEDMYRSFPIPTEGYTINLINALSGWSKNTGAYYYIAHGLHCGEQVGQLLMEAFACYLKHYIDPVEVYFVGYDPLQPTDFSEALDWWNRLETQTGIHCLTLEMGSVK
jgi:hypothetical protein